MWAAYLLSIPFCIAGMLWLFRKDGTATVGDMILAIIMCFVPLANIVGLVFTFWAFNEKEINKVLDTPAFKKKEK